MSNVTIYQKDELARQMIVSSISDKKNDEHNNKNTLKNVEGCVKYC